MSESKFLIFSPKKPALPIALPILLTGSFLLVIQDKNQGHHPDSSFSHLTSSPPVNPVDFTFKMRLGSDYFSRPVTTATLISLNYRGRFFTDLCAHSCPFESAPKSAGRVILFKHKATTSILCSNFSNGSHLVQRKGQGLCNDSQGHCLPIFSHPPTLTCPSFLLLTVLQPHCPPGPL